MVITDGCSPCFQGLVRWRRARRSARPTRSSSSDPVAPVVKERVLSTKNSGALDIHTLRISQNPCRRLSRSYRKINTLGSGGFGSVFRVEHITTGEQRAGKVISKPEDPVEMARVFTEVQVLIQLDHPNIMKFYEFFEDSKAICLVTELCDGGNLGELDPRYDDPEEIRLLFRDVVSAVAYCHSEGVAHRDLKFENCLLTDGGCRRRRIAKVIDFGLASLRRVGEHPDKWMAEPVGTSFFVAPEVLNCDSGWKRYGPECDMWSIGVMLYMIATDMHPFTTCADNRTALLEGICRAQVRTLPLDTARVPFVVRDLILKLLTKDPRRRLKARDALEHPWFKEPDGQLAESCCEPRTPKVSPSNMRTLLGRIHSFAHLTRFEQAVLTLVAHEATRRDVEDLRAAFASLDAARAGWLSRGDIQKGFERLGIKLSEEELETVFHGLDPDRDDKIHYTGWLAATLPPSALTHDKAVSKVFDFFDVHGDGKVSQEDLREVLGENVGADVGGGEGLVYDGFRSLICDVARRIEERQRHASPCAGEAEAL